MKRTARLAIMLIMAAAIVLAFAGCQEEKEATSIEVTTLPRTQYYLMDDLIRPDFTGGEITVYYRSGNPKKVSMTDSSVSYVSGFDLEIKGNTDITVRYGSLFATYEINVDDVALSEINVKTAPKSTYNLGEPLDLTGGKITLVHNSGAREDKNMTDSGVTVSGYDTWKSGEQTLTVTYGGKTATFKVNVDGVAVTRITMNPAPQRRIYYTEQDADAFDPTGGKIHVLYENGDEDDIDLDAEGVEVAFSSVQTNVAADDVIIDVSYMGKTTYFTIDVVENLATALVVDPENDEPDAEFYEGDEFNPAGIVLKATMVDGTERELDLARESEVSMEGFTSVRPGPVNVKLSYRSQEIIITVQVKQLVVESFELKKFPTKQTYVEGDEALDLRGATIIIKYNNGDETDPINLIDAGGNLYNGISITGFDTTIRPGRESETNVPVYVLLTTKDAEGGIEVFDDVFLISVVKPTTTPDEVTDRQRMQYLVGHLMWSWGYYCLEGYGQYRYVIKANGATVQEDIKTFDTTLFLMEYLELRDLAEKFDQASDKGSGSDYHYFTTTNYVHPWYRFDEALTYEDCYNMLTSGYTGKNASGEDVLRFVGCYDYIMTFEKNLEQPEDFWELMNHYIEMVRRYNRDSTYAAGMKYFDDDYDELENLYQSLTPNDRMFLRHTIDDEYRQTLYGSGSTKSFAEFNNAFNTIRQGYYMHYMPQFGGTEEGVVSDEVNTVMYMLVVEEYYDLYMLEAGNIQNFVDLAKLLVLCYDTIYNPAVFDNWAGSALDKYYREFYAIVGEIYVKNMDDSIPEYAKELYENLDAALSYIWYMGSAYRDATDFILFYEQIKADFIDGITGDLETFYKGTEVSFWYFGNDAITMEDVFKYLTDDYYVGFMALVKDGGDLEEFFEDYLALAVQWFDIKEDYEYGDDTEFDDDVKALFDAFMGLSPANQSKFYQLIHNGHTPGDDHRDYATNPYLYNPGIFFDMVKNVYIGYLGEFDYRVDLIVLFFALERVNETYVWLANTDPAETAEVKANKDRFVATFERLLAGIADVDADNEDQLTPIADEFNDLFGTILNYYQGEYDALKPVTTPEE